MRECGRPPQQDRTLRALVVPNPPGVSPEMVKQTKYVLSDAVMKQPIYGSKTVLTYVPMIQVDVSGEDAEVILYHIQVTRAD